MTVLQSKPPAPFDEDSFTLLQEGIYEGNGENVWINEQRDFAFLDPRPTLDYEHYVPRNNKLKQQVYRQTRTVEKKRFEKIAPWFHKNIGRVLEIGAGDGAFLKILGREFPGIQPACVEPDQLTVSSRSQIKGLLDFQSLQEAIASGSVFDVICFFHVLEHIIDPASFLKEVHQLTHPRSIVMIEVPSLFDPLLTIYQCQSYQKFYFQRQHPYVYSNDSLPRLMTHHGFSTSKMIAYQRYGIENHLHWLAKQEPGGSEVLSRIFSKTSQSYLNDLEANGKTDTVIWVGQPHKR